MQCISACNASKKWRLEREEAEKPMVGGQTSGGGGAALSFLPFLCPFTVMAIIKKTRSLFNFIHPKIGKFRILYSSTHKPSAPLCHFASDSCTHKASAIETHPHKPHFVIALYVFVECPLRSFCSC